MTDFIDFGYSAFFEKRLIAPVTRGTTSAIDYDSQFEDESVDANKLAFGAIITEKLADGSVTSVKVKEIGAEKILTSTLETAVDIGNPSAGYVRLDGPNNRIVVHDGNTIRIVIGEV